MGRKHELVEEAEGHLAETLTLPFDGERLLQLLTFIAKGLLWHHWKVVLTRDFDVRVLSITNFVAPFFAQMLSQNARNRIEANLGNGAFVYEGAQGMDYPEFSVWSISLFGGLTLLGDHHALEEQSTRFIAVTAKADFLMRFDKLVA